MRLIEEEEAPMKLINRENILRYIGDLQRTVTPDVHKLLQAVWNYVAAAVDYSGEYVPVVRCRDCDKTDTPIDEEDEHDFWCMKHGSYVCEDDFCSYGERRGK